MKSLECKQIFQELPPFLTENDTVSLDLELSGLNENQLHRPSGKLASLACSFDGETAYIIFEESQVQEFLNRIEKGTWIFHNGTFDIGHLKRWAEVPERENFRDTMIIEKIMWADYYDDYGLNDLVRRYLKCYMPKDVRKEFITLDAPMTQEQIEYACLDVIGTWQVDKAQQTFTDENGKLLFDEKDRLIWSKVDLDNVWLAVSMSGFTLDVDKWYELAERNEAIVAKIEEELGTKYGHMEDKTSGRGKNKVTEQIFVPFNPGSPAQVLSILQDRHIPVTSTGDDVIRPFAETDEFVNKILIYRASAKKSSTYGKNYLQFVEADGRIYPSLNVIGTTTGRNSCRNPNLQQVPRDPEYRSCFIAGHGRKLIIADYSAQEPRIFAYVCQDAKLLEIFKSGKDIYCEVARIAFGETITKKDKERRNQIKALILGLIYGLTPYGFARDNGVEQEVAEEMYATFFKTFPQAEQWVNAQQKTNHGITRTILGRKSHLHPYNVQWKNNALNNPMQGCISGDSLILTDEHGLTQIHNINGQKVSVWDGTQFSWAHISYSGKKQKCILLLQSGQEIVCSPNHKFLTTNSYGSQIWRSVEDISKLKGKVWIRFSENVPDFSAPIEIPNRFIGKARNSHTESLLNMTGLELGTWVGRIASDGSVGDGYIRLLVAEHEKEILPYLVDITKKIFQPRVSKQERTGNQPMHKLDLDHTALSRYLIEEGIKFQIPRFVLRDKEILRGYLIGMFDGDGTISKVGAISLTFGQGDTHYRWASQVVTALSTFGIYARISRCTGRINVNILKRDCDRFLKEIGFLNPKKQHRCVNITSNHRKNNWGNIYGKSVPVKSVTITEEYIHMYDVVDSETGQFMVNGVVSHNSGADMTKLAIKKFRKDNRELIAQGKLGIILPVHDEVVIWAVEDMAPEAKVLLETAMISVAELIHPGVPAVVEASICSDWSEK